MAICTVILGLSWPVLGASWGHFGQMRGHLGAKRGLDSCIFGGEVCTKCEDDAVNLNCYDIFSSRSFLKPSWAYFWHLGAILASLGASWGHLGHTWGHLGIHSAIWEVWLHALKLTTLSALPVPMLKQVYVGSQKP